MTKSTAAPEPYARETVLAQQFCVLYPLPPDGRDALARTLAAYREELRVEEIARLKVRGMR